MHIFWATASDSDPPSTVKSWEKTKVCRPSTLPYPVTTASPGNLWSARPELGGAVLDEGVELLEGPLVQEEVDALPRRQLSAPVLGVDATLTAPELRPLTPPGEVLPLPVDGPLQHHD